jgi:long-chain fatty acid transport protein
MLKFLRKAGVLAVGAALGAISSNAWAGGFGIGTQSGSGTGNAFAGGAAVADDASVVWSNPAGMTLLPPGKQITGALHVLKPSFKFRNEGSTGLYAAPGTGEGGDGGDWAFVPNGFFAMELTPQMRLGVAVNAPFGLKTEYDSGWRGQVAALTSEIRSVNINPSLAYKISDAVSIGAGLNIQWIEAELSSFVPAPPTGPGVLRLKADDIGYGFNLGIMAAIGPATRVGAHYRSRIKYTVEGDASFAAAPAANGNIRADLKVPETFSLSILHALTPKWEIMGDITRTGWDSLQQLTVGFTSGPLAGTTLPSLQFRWDDTMRYGIGANYRWSDQTKLRFGVAFDETPTNDVDRTPRLPDQDRKWIAFGVQHRLSKAGVLEVAYAHEFIKDARVTTGVPGVPGCAAGCLRGSFENKADIVSVQYSHSF